ncbi:MAG: hypothetical protein ACLQFM_04725 [Terriglobales bacterium]
MEDFALASPVCVPDECVGDANMSKASKIWSFADDDVDVEVDNEASRLRESLPADNEVAIGSAIGSATASRPSSDEAGTGVSNAFKTEKVAASVAAGDAAAVVGDKIPGCSAEVAANSAGNLASFLETASPSRPASSFASDLDEVLPVNSKT